MDNKIHTVTGKYQYEKAIEKIGDRQISYDSILGDDVDEIGEAATPCDSGSINYNACKKNTDKTGKKTVQSTSKDSKINNKLITVDSYMHDDDEPNNSGPKGNKYKRVNDDVVTYSTYKREGLRWRRDSEETYHLFRSIDKRNVILPADDAPLSENVANDKTIAVYEDLLDDNGDFPLGPNRINLDYEIYIRKVLDRAKQKRLEDNLDRELDKRFKKTKLADFFNDPVASAVEVLEYVNWWIANALSLPPADPAENDEREEIENINFAIHVVGLSPDNKVLFSYSHDFTNDSDGGED